MRSNNWPNNFPISDIWSTSFVLVVVPCRLRIDSLSSGLWYLMKTLCDSWTGMCLKTSIDQWLLWRVKSKDVKNGGPTKISKANEEKLQKLTMALQLAILTRVRHRIILHMEWQNSRTLKCVPNIFYFVSWFWSSVFLLGFLHTFDFSVSIYPLSSSRASSLFVTLHSKGLLIFIHSRTFFLFTNNKHSKTYERQSNDGKIYYDLTISF